MRNAGARPGQPELPADAFDYLDCVESAEPIGEVAEPSAWLGVAFSGMPTWVTNLRRAALRPGEWAVVDSSKEVLHMVQPTSIGTATILARTIDGRRRLTTGIRFAPGAGRWVWAVIGPIHRRSARRVVAGVEIRAAGAA